MRAQWALRTGLTEPPSRGARDESLTLRNHIPLHGGFIIWHKRVRDESRPSLSRSEGRIPKQDGREDPSGKFFF